MRYFTIHLATPAGEQQAAAGGSIAIVQRYRNRSRRVVLVAVAFAGGGRRLEPMFVVSTTNGLQMTNYKRSEGGRETQGRDRE